MEQPNLFCNGEYGSPWLMLSRLALMRQAAFPDGPVFNLSPSVDDCPVATEVDIGRCQIAKAFVVAAVIVAFDESANAGLRLPGK